MSVPLAHALPLAGGAIAAAVPHAVIVLLAIAAGAIALSWWLHRG